jgi:serine phosphatase RsbU (regulator of sigma subunit)
LLGLAFKRRKLRSEHEALLQEMNLLRSALLPSISASVPVSVAYRPAHRAPAGGDFYDAFELGGDRTGVILGDVSGHGRDALARTTFIRYTLRAYLEAGLEPREVVKVGADALAGQLDGGFATVTVAVHEPASGRFTYASAGHPPPVVVGSDEPYEPVTACSAPPLGIGEPTGFRQTTFTLTAGARACLYTDGVTEARVDGGLLGVERLQQTLAALPPGADADALLDAIADTADEVTDDMAVCLINAAAGAPAAGQRIEVLEVDEREVGDSLERFLRACGVPLAEVPGILREAGEAARREGSATVRVRANGFRPGVDVVPGNLVRLAERRRAIR